MQKDNQNAAKSTKTPERPVSYGVLLSHVLSRPRTIPFLEERRLLSAR